MIRGNLPDKKAEPSAELDSNKCPCTTKYGKACKLNKLPGYDHCHFHLTIEEEKQWKIQKDGNVAIPCRFILRNGKRCPHTSLQGFNVCYQHATKHERVYYRKQQALKRKKESNPPFSPGSQKKRKQYDGILQEKIYKAAEDEVYGFYEGAFSTASQRALFHQAPVADIDDDIKIVRYLIRDALYNQMLYDDALRAGNVDAHGFVLFSREVNETTDENGMVIARQKKEIRRKRDYLKDISSLELLLTKMLTARIELLKLENNEQKGIVPFHFNILAPSDPNLNPQNIKQLPDAPFRNPEEIPVDDQSSQSNQSSQSSQSNQTSKNPQEINNINNINNGTTSMQRGSE